MLDDAVLCFSLVVLSAVLCFFPGRAATADTGPLKIAVFNVDATPPVGARLCNGGIKPVVDVDDPLSARGVLLLPANQGPIVLCAVDWVGIGNTAHDAWREALAKAAGTPVERVAVHTLHQHDAPGCDFSVEEMLAPRGLSGAMFAPEFARLTIRRTAEALAECAKEAKPVTHIGIGKAKVGKVASNRRILRPDGTVKQMRASTCRDAALRAEPEGVIDPFVRSLSFWNGDTPLAVLSYYATHPMSRYGEGHVSSEIAGLARAARERALPGVPQIYFTGASGNVAAGKYNDGNPANRAILTDRLADGMQRAWEATVKTPIGAEDIKWDVRDVLLPPRNEITDEKETATLDDESLKTIDRIRAARELAYRKRCADGHTIDIARLRIGPIQVLHMPGELFIEYQLAAHELAPDSTVCMAAYGDYGPGYIGTAVAYTQGGYETSLHTSRSDARAEAILLAAMRELLVDGNHVAQRRGK